MDLRGLGSSGPSALLCWGRYGSYMPVAGFVLRTSSRLAVDAGRLSVRAIPRTLMPAFRQSAMLMRSSWLRYLELIFWGMSTVERYQSTDGFSFLPFDRVLPLRHTLPVRLDTPTARAACVKFMPASRCSTYRRRRAAHISPRVAYSTPSNTHLSTWPSHQSARRCDDHWNPPLPDYATPYVANALRTVGLNLNGTVMSPAEAASRASVGPVMVVVPIVVLLVAYMLLSRFRREGVERK